MFSIFKSINTSYCSFLTSAKREYEKMYAIQLDMLESNDDISLLKRENKMLRDSMDALRKGLFARHNALDKRWIETNRRLDFIERNLSK